MVWISPSQYKIPIPVYIVISMCVLFTLNTYKDMVSHHSVMFSENNSSLTFPLETCKCHRTINVTANIRTNFSSTTCSEDAYKRGSDQHVVSFSFYGDPATPHHKSKQYFAGIQNNLDSLPQFYPGWTMRLYHDLTKEDPLLQDLCSLACSNNHLDLCYVRNLPGTPFQDASRVFPMNWKFFPVIDEQVSVMLPRDLDSIVSEREAAAVSEWLQSNASFHIMRDHPDQGIPMLGSMWGWKEDGKGESRKRWKQAWREGLKDKLAWAGRGEWGPDQTFLRRYVWRWAKKDAISHDSYHCKKFSNTKHFPTRREEAPNNFVGSVATDNYTLRVECPLKCRPEGRKDWLYC